MSGGIKHFTDLLVWQKSHELVKALYLITKKFPAEEKFGLVSQLKRAASSITANIAEGFGRFHFKEKVHFYYQARGSNSEIQNHLILAYDLGFITKDEFNKLISLAQESYQMLCGLIRSTTDNLSNF